MSDDEREEKELDLTSPEVVTKYKNAAEIVNSEYPSPTPPPFPSPCTSVADWMMARLLKE